MGIKGADIVRLNWKSTFVDGSVSSNEGEEPLEFIQGHSPMPGLDEAVLGHNQGDRFTIFTPMADAFGARDEGKIERYPLSDFAGLIPTGKGSDALIGAVANMTNPDDGTHAEARVIAVEGDVVIMDFNHPLAGKDLTYDVEIVEVFTGMRAMWRALKQDVSGQ